MTILSVISLVLVAVTGVLSVLDKAAMEKLAKEIAKIDKKCTNESKANEYDVAQIITHKVPDSREGKCLIFCLHKHFKIQKDDGSFNREGTLETLGPLKEDFPELYEKMLNITEKCSKKVVNDKDPCLTAAKLASCAAKEGALMPLGSKAEDEEDE